MNPIPPDNPETTVGLIDIRIQVRIGLVEHHQKRIPIVRPGQGHSLTLACRQCRPDVPDPGVVTLRQMQNEVVHASRLGCRDDPRTGGIATENAQYSRRSSPVASGST